MRSTFEERVFPNKSVFGNVDVFGFLLEGDFGCFLRDFFRFVIILAWNRDGKW